MFIKLHRPVLSSTVYQSIVFISISGSVSTIKIVSASTGVQAQHAASWFNFCPASVFM